MNTTKPSPIYGFAPLVSLSLPERTGTTDAADSAAALVDTGRTLVARAIVDLEGQPGLGDQVSALQAAAVLFDLAFAALDLVHVPKQSARA
jgi:hypothetical protein